jgi:NADPH:quinone reductase-like Zn-dependent oxidoreductase
MSGNSRAVRPLESKVAVVTGASSGIGRAAAIELARRGAKVVASGRRIETVDAVVRTIREEGLEAAPVIAREGRFLVVGFPAGIPKLPLNLVLLKSCQIVGVFWADWVEIHPAEFEMSARELLELYSRGAIKPVISRRFSLAEGRKAIELLAARSAVGKIVVMVD